jgi:hypothetical protein
VVDGIGSIGIVIRITYLVDGRGVSKNGEFSIKILRGVKRRNF